MIITCAFIFFKIGTQKNGMVLKCTSIFTKLRQSKSKDDKRVLDHQPNLIDGSKDPHSKIPSCIMR